MVSKEQTTFTPSLTPTRATTQLLGRVVRLTVPLRATFIPTSGPAQVATATATFGHRGFAFDNGIENWQSAWGDATLAASSAHRHSGKDALKITLHAAAYPAVNVVGQEESLWLLEPGIIASMWIYRPRGTPPVGIRPMVRMGSDWTECRGAEVRPRAGRWVQLHITVPRSLAHCVNPGNSSSGLAVQAVGVELDDKGMAARGKSIYLDDVGW